MRTIIVGDTHGCYKEFLQLLKKVDYKKKKDYLILLGDLVDRGPCTYEMLRLAMAWKEDNPRHFHMVRGNHEQMMVEQSKDLQDRLIWWCVGKAATLRSLNKHKKKMQSYIPWIEKHMPLYLEEEGYRCVHASVREDKIEANSLDILVHDHSTTKKNVYAGPLTIVGHTPLDAPTYFDGSGVDENGESGQALSYHTWTPLPKHGIICIDTGCAYGKKLTAMIVQEGQYYLDYVPGGLYFTGKTQGYIKYVKMFCELKDRISLPFKKVLSKIK